VVATRPGSRHHRAQGGPTGGAGDAALDRWIDRAVSRDVSLQIVGHDVSGDHPAKEVRVEIPAVGHEVVLGNHVTRGRRQVDRGSSAAAVGSLTHRIRNTASDVRLPTNDSHVRPADCPQASERGTRTEEFPITVERIGVNWSRYGFNRPSGPSIAGSGVTAEATGVTNSAERWITLPLKGS